MTHQNNTTNWVIQGHNGQSPQVVKFQSGGKSITGIVTPTLTTSQQVKISQAFTTTGNPAQVVKTVVTSPKYVTKAVPINVNALPKGTRTVRLTPTQMSHMQNKIINSQKVQITDGITTTSTSVPTIQTTQNILQNQNSQNQKNVSPHILTRKRQDPLAFDYPQEAKRHRKSDKVGKGLRHFSMKVCEKVRKKGTTTYNEVADELVGEFTNPSNNTSLADQYDQKNIRRRVYDALNVLMAMNIISKEKKEIRWIGLPTNSHQECIQLEKEKKKKLAIIKEKRKQLLELIMNQIAFKNLAQRNRFLEEAHGKPHPNSYIQLPFIVVHTNKKTLIDCSISNDKMEYLFQFNDKFEINDDAEILKYIGMHMGLDTGDCTPENLAKMKSMVPASLEEYVNQLAQGGLDDFDEYSESEGAGTSSMCMLNSEELVEAHLDEDNSHQSSSNDNLDYSDDEAESDMSSDIECN